MTRFIKLLVRIWGLWVVAAALAVTAGLIAIGGRDPVAAYTVLLNDGLFDPYGFADILVKMSPLVLTGLAVIVPLRAGLYNIGGEGQMYMGALCATLPAIYLPPLPLGLHVVICSVCGMAGGAAWAAIAGVLKAYRGTNEVISTLLLNYIAINLINFVVSGPLLDPGAPYPYSSPIQESAQLPRLSSTADVHAGLLVGLSLALSAWFVFARTPAGLAMRMVGENVQVAAYAGVPVRRTVVLALAAGGAAAGLAGAYEVMGVKHRLFHLFGGGYGYDGVVVAFLAGGHPVWGMVTAFFIAVLRVGGNQMQRGAGVPITVVATVEGLIVVFVAASLALRRIGTSAESDQADLPGPKSDQSPLDTPQQPI